MRWALGIEKPRSPSALLNWPTWTARTGRCSPPPSPYTHEATGASTTVRGAHHVAGSLLGVAVAAGIEATHPASAMQLLLVLGGAWGMNLLLPRNYTYAVICATVMALAANMATAPPRPSRTCFSRVPRSAFSVWPARWWCSGSPDTAPTT
ncbi:FUSC family protein [Streptomyces sp. NPDC051064]|uniref:FUSC family protein n=1 Tax=Streptomyces sp. NPDC051064 TaxID=3365641 RepID=UPI0037AA637D